MEQIKPANPLIYIIRATVIKCPFKLPLAYQLKYDREHLIVIPPANYLFTKVLLLLS